ncbi:MAG TPA: hypothetical protein VIQ31_33990, partial [Phormidium sp.]
MSDSLSLRDRYFALIDEIVQTTLKGNIRSKQQVYQMLLRGITPGTGEIFEQCLSDRVNATQSEIDNPTDELKQAKATRTLRALQTIEGEWERYQQENRVASAIATATSAIVNTESDNRLIALLQAIDPNQAQALNLDQIQQLATSLQKEAEKSPNSETIAELQELALGLTEGLKSWGKLQDHLVSWIYDQNRGKLGFEGVPGETGPWRFWASLLDNPFPKSLFETLALNHSVAESV